MTQPPEREIGEELTSAMHDSTGAYELVIAAIAAAALGFWIDTVFGLMPLFTLVFAVAGFVGGGYSLWLRYNDQMQTAAQARSTRTDRGTIA